MEDRKRQMQDIVIKFFDSCEDPNKTEGLIKCAGSPENIFEHYYRPNEWERIGLGQFFSDRGGIIGRSCVFYVPITPVVLRCNIEKDDFEEVDETICDRVNTIIYRLFEQKYDDDGQQTVGIVEYHLWFNKFSVDAKDYSKKALSLRRAIENEPIDLELFLNLSPEDDPAFDFCNLDTRILHPAVDSHGQRHVVAELVSPPATEPADIHILIPREKRPDAFKAAGKKISSEKRIRFRADLDNPNAEIMKIARVIPYKDVYDKLIPGRTEKKKWICPKCLDENLVYFKKDNRVNCLGEDHAPGCGYNGDIIDLLFTTFKLDPMTALRWFHKNFNIEEYDIDSPDNEVEDERFPF